MSARPHDLHAEASLIGAMLITSEAIDAVVGIVETDDFYKPAHGHIFDAVVDLHAAGRGCDVVTVKDELQRRGLLEAIGGPSTLTDLQGDTPAIRNAAEYARIVARMAWRRFVMDAAALASDAADKDDTDKALRIFADAVNVTPHAGRTPGQDLDAFLDSDLPAYNWLVERLLERGDRLILTGPEGGGKSTLLRQIAVQLAAGVHPFDEGHPIEPRRVLLVDLENGEAHLRRELAKLRALLPDGAVHPGHLIVKSEPAGLDLLDQADATWLDNEVRRAGCDVLALGPLYKLASGDPTAEETGKAVSGCLDRIRAKHDTSILLEAHSPHAANGGKRPTRPYGWSGWLRWPEFGIHLDEKGPVTHWRGARDQRDWPAALTRDGHWPWTPIHDSRGATFAAMLQAVHDLGRIPSNRELAGIVGCAEGTVRNAIKNNPDEWANATAGLAK